MKNNKTQHPLIARILSGSHHILVQPIGLEKLSIKSARRPASIWMSWKVLESQEGMIYFSHLSSSC